MKIALATYKNLPDLTDDDRLLLPKFQEKGIEAHPVCWDDPTVHWRNFDRVIIRSCWDYHLRLDEFLGWIKKLEHLGIPIYNSPNIIRWNCHKGYLTELQEKGIEIVPTVFVQNSDSPDLAQLLKERNWQRAVIKPTVSATAYETWLTEPQSTESDQIKLEASLEKNSEMMIQKFMPEIKTAGEWSLIFFAGKFSHAVLKKPKAGDFRVQDNFGGSSKQIAAPKSLIEQAQKIVNCVAEKCLYARVDGIENGETFILMELELIEPVLFWGLHPRAIDRFVEAVMS